MSRDPAAAGQRSAAPRVRPAFVVGLALALTVATLGLGALPGRFPPPAPEPPPPPPPPAAPARALTDMRARERQPGTERGPTAALPTNEPATTGAPVLHVRASATASALAARPLQSAFESMFPDLRLQLDPESDRGAIDHVLLGKADAAIVAAELSQQERHSGLHEQALGYHVLALVVHVDNPLRALDGKAMREGLSGVRETWGELGAPPPFRELAVQVLLATSPDPLQDRASSLLILGDRPSRKAVRLPDDRAVLRRVQLERGALGVVGLAAAGDGGGFHVLAIGGVAPSPATFTTRQYPYGCAVRVVWRGNAPAALQALLGFARRDEGRRALAPTLTLP